MRNAFLLLSLTFLLETGACPAPPDAVWESVLEACCEIIADGHLAASGFFVDCKGTCLTCAHALLGVKKVEVLLRGGARRSALLLGMDTAHDAAVLRVNLTGKERFTFLKRAKRFPEVCWRVFVAGCAVYRHGLILRGSVASAETHFEYLPNLKTYVPVRYVSGMVPRGMSGGPWLNERGEVFGLQSGMLAHNDSMWGIAFVIPLESLDSFLADPKKARPAGDIGAAVEELWEHSGSKTARYGKDFKEGLLLTKVLIGGACWEAGLREGDLITAAAGRPCRYRDRFLSLVRSLEPGRFLVVEAVRVEGGKVERRKVRLRLGDASRAWRMPVAPGGGG